MKLDHFLSHDDCQLGQSEQKKAMRSESSDKKRGLFHRVIHQDLLRTRPPGILLLLADEERGGGGFTLAPAVIVFSLQKMRLSSLLVRPSFAKRAEEEEDYGGPSSSFLSAMGGRPKRSKKHNPTYSKDSSRSSLKERKNVFAKLMLNQAEYKDTRETYCAWKKRGA